MKERFANTTTPVTKSVVDRFGSAKKVTALLSADIVEKPNPVIAIELAEVARNLRLCDTITASCVTFATCVDTVPENPLVVAIAKRAVGDAGTLSSENETTTTCCQSVT